jgi:hypothetical protein
MIKPCGRRGAAAASSSREKSGGQARGVQVEINRYACGFNINTGNPMVRWLRPGPAAGFSGSLFSINPRGAPSWI